MLRPFLSCRKGGAAAEMALILPLGVLILFSTLEGAHYFYAEHQVVKGVRDGARWGARQSFGAINCENGNPTISGDVITGVRNLTRTGQLTGGDARVLGWEDDDITVTVNCPTGTGSQTGIYDATDRAPQIRVVANVDYVSLFGGLGIIGDDADLNAEQESVVMGI